MIAVDPTPSGFPPRLQDLQPAWARFCLGIERYLLLSAKDLRNHHLLLACSAGSDSMALLLIMRILAPRHGLRLSAAHLDHGLRRESRNEALALAAYCSTLDVPLTTGRSNVALFARKTATGIEEAGRTLRYRFLFKLRKKLNADLVMTAHHADDLAEDVIMRLMRGSGWPGLAGMPSWAPERRLVRPLLHTPKQALQAFLRAFELTWHEDAGNEDQRFRRNRIRRTILPRIKREFPGMHRAVSQVHALAELDRDYFASSLAPLVLKAENNDHTLARKDLESLHPSLRLRLFKAVLDELGPGQVRHDALLRLERAWQNSRIHAEVQFSGGKTATITTRGVRFNAAPATKPDKAKTT